MSIDIVGRLKRVTLWVCVVLCAAAFSVTDLRGPAPFRPFGSSILTVRVYSSPDGHYAFQDVYIRRDPALSPENHVGNLVLAEEPLFGPKLRDYRVFQIHPMWSEFRYHLRSSSGSARETLDYSSKVLVKDFDAWLENEVPLGDAKMPAARIAHAAKGPTPSTISRAQTGNQYLWTTEPVRLWYPTNVVRDAGEVLKLPLLVVSLVVLAYPTLRERRERTRRAGLCPNCRYDLKSQFEQVCPECGKDPKADRRR